MSQIPVRYHSSNGIGVIGLVAVAAAASYFKGRRILPVPKWCTDDAPAWRNQFWIDPVPRVRDDDAPLGTNAGVRTTGAAAPQQQQTAAAVVVAPPPQAAAAVVATPAVISAPIVAAPPAAATGSAPVDLLAHEQMRFAREEMTRQDTRETLAQDERQRENEVLKRVSELMRSTAARPTVTAFVMSADRACAQFEAAVVQCYRVNKGREFACADAAAEYQGCVAGSR